MADISIADQIAAVRAAVGYIENKNGPSKTSSELRAAIETLERATNLERTFSLVWKAQQGAIKRWAETCPWPDWSDLAKWIEADPKPKETPDERSGDEGARVIT
jgi:hypothetical protein